MNDLAEYYSYPRLDSSIDLVTADGAEFMAVNEDRFDLVCIDVFNDDLVPPEFETQEFLQQCQAALNPGGLLLYNRLYQEDRDKKATDRFQEQVFKQVFAEGEHIMTQGNMILVAKKSLPDRPHE